MELFEPHIYRDRRTALAEKGLSGLAIFPSNPVVYSNYPAQQYPFRQDSSFLYYFGLSLTNAIGVVDLDTGESYLFANDIDINDVIWTGARPTIAQQGEWIGIDQVFALDQLPQKFEHRPIHFLQPYHVATTNWIQKLFPGSTHSQKLTALVIAQRSIKSIEELDELEEAIAVSQEIHDLIMLRARPEVAEREILAEIYALLYRKGMHLAYGPILSKRGEILHNHSHDLILEPGDLLLADIGAESRKGYSADITRTFPVSGTFDTRQKAIYEIVLSTLDKASQDSQSGVSYQWVHNQASLTIAKGLTELGLMKGDFEEAVKEGAHALFFPHGLGHMLGLDTHDMEALGEKLVGYSDEVNRSKQFGAAYLRLGKKLETGYVITIEPGIYFIPKLFELWRAEKKFDSFLNYTEIEKYLGFGGIRIEDNYVIENDRARKLGPPIARTVEEVEFMCQVS